MRSIGAGSAAGAVDAQAIGQAVRRARVAAGWIGFTVGRACPPKPSPAAPRRWQGRRRPAQPPAAVRRDRATRRKEGSPRERARQAVGRNWDGRLAPVPAGAPAPAQRKEWRPMVNDPARESERQDETGPGLRFDRVTRRRVLGLLGAGTATAALAACGGASRPRRPPRPPRRPPPSPRGATTAPAAAPAATQPRARRPPPPSRPARRRRAARRAACSTAPGPTSCRPPGTSTCS